MSYKYVHFRLKHSCLGVLTRSKENNDVCTVFVYIHQIVCVFVYVFFIINSCAISCIHLYMEISCLRMYLFMVYCLCFNLILVFACEF